MKSEEILKTAVVVVMALFLTKVVVCGVGLRREGFDLRNRGYDDWKRPHRIPADRNMNFGAEFKQAVDVLTGDIAQSDRGALGNMRTLKGIYRDGEGRLHGKELPNFEFPLRSLGGHMLVIPERREPV